MNVLEYMRCKVWMQSVINLYQMRNEACINCGANTNKPQLIRINHEEAKVI